MKFYKDKYIIISALIIAAGFLVLWLAGVFGGSEKNLIDNPDNSGDLPAQGQSQIFASTDPVYTFYYPKNYTASETMDQNRVKTVVIRLLDPPTDPSALENGQSGAGEPSSEIGAVPQSEPSLPDEPANKVLHLVITPFAETDLVVTKERILRDLPNIRVAQEQEITVGKAGGAAVRGLKFFSDHPHYGGNSQEAWFYFDDRLYQISVHPSEESLLTEILKSWKFEL